MEKHKLIVALNCLLISGLFANTVTVNLTNGTTGKIPAVDQVALIAPRMGMQTLATAKPVNGTAVFENVDVISVPALVATVTYQGIIYSSEVRESTFPGSQPGEYLVDLQVYDITKKADSLKAEIPFFVITAYGDSLYIQKEYQYFNNSMPPATIMSPEGYIHFFIPPMSQNSASVSVTHGSMPLKVFPNIDGGKATLMNELKPGETKVDIEYQVSFKNNQASIAETFFQDFPHFHVFVRPANLQVSALGLESGGVNNDQNMAIFAASNVKTGQTLSINVRGNSMANMKPVLLPRMSLTNSMIIIILAALIMAIGLSFALTHDVVVDENLASQLTALQKTRRELLGKLARISDRANPAEKQQIQHRLRKVYQHLQEHNAL